MTDEIKPPVPAFHLWIDADACPKILRDLIFRASDRHVLPVTFVANQPLGITPSKMIHFHHKRAPRKSVPFLATFLATLSRTSLKIAPLASL